VFRLNALYELPFHGNRVVSGWQITAYGRPVRPAVQRHDGIDLTNQLGITTTPRPTTTRTAPLFGEWRELSGV